MDAPSPSEDRSERKGTRKMKRLLFTLTTLAFGVLAATVALGQQPAKQFEVASISHPNQPNRIPDAFH